MSVSEDSNPYRSPEDVSAPKGACRYADLHRECPRCGRRFSTLLYRKLYPRKFRLKALAWFAFSFILGLLAVSVLGSLALLLTLFLAAWGMTFHKAVTVYCRECKWSEKFMVRNRG